MKHLEIRFKGYNLFPYVISILFALLTVPAGVYIAGRWAESTIVAIIAGVILFLPTLVSCFILWGAQSVMEEYKKHMETYKKDIKDLQSALEQARSERDQAANEYRPIWAKMRSSYEQFAALFLLSPQGYVFPSNERENVRALKNLHGGAQLNCPDWKKVETIDTDSTDQVIMLGQIYTIPKQE